MKYKHNQYTEGASICGAIFGALFLYWGINSLIPPGNWIWGIISTAIGVAILSGQIAALANKSKLRRTVKYEFESNPDASVDQISKNTGISKKDVQAIILELKMRGELRGKFSSSTGKLKVVQEDAVQEQKVSFCTSCGTPIKKEEAQYCSYCGASIQH